MVLLKSLVSDPDAPDNLQTTQTECSVLIKNGLRKSQRTFLFLMLCNCYSTGMITNIQNLGMNYINYKTAIVQKYHVQLVGWPSDIPFVNPHQLTNTAAANSLKTSLTVSTCKWVIMSKRQQKDYAATLVADAEGGQVVGRKRKVRSDKGRKRKLAADDEDDDDENDENVRPSSSKKQKSTASRKTSKISKASAAKKSNRVAKVLPPAALKSTEYIDSENDSDN